MNSKFNLKTYFGDDLHDYLENPEDVKKFIETEIHKIDELNDEEKFKKLSQLGVHHRQLRNYDKAHELRIKKANSDLISSTEFALKITRQKV